MSFTQRKLPAQLQPQPTPWLRKGRETEIQGDTETDSSQAQYTVEQLQALRGPHPLLPQDNHKPVVVRLSTTTAEGKMKRSLDDLSRFI